MLKRPPHILVTTPESLYILLTARASRATLTHVTTIIVDEIHAVIGGRRGTGGSSGASYLKSTLEKRAFPELWDLRTTMSSSHAY